MWSPLGARLGRRTGKGTGPSFLVSWTSKIRAPPLSISPHCALAATYSDCGAAKGFSSNFNLDTKVVNVVERSRNFCTQLLDVGRRDLTSTHDSAASPPCFLLAMLVAKLAKSFASGQPRRDCGAPCEIWRTMWGRLQRHHKWKHPQPISPNALKIR